MLVLKIKPCMPKYR